MRIAAVALLAWLSALGCGQAAVSGAVSSPTHAPVAALVDKPTAPVDAASLGAALGPPRVGAPSLGAFSVGDFGSSAPDEDGASAPAFGPLGLLGERSTTSVDSPDRGDDAWPIQSASWLGQRGDGANVILTFDDGPGAAGEADALLDVLRAERVRALLFPSGNWIEREGVAWIERARREGHVVCNHSRHHWDLRVVRSDVVETEITDGAGYGACALLRPPRGSFDERVAGVAERLGYRLLLWDVDSRDWKGESASSIYHRVLKRVRPGSVVLFHIQCRETVAILPLLVRALRAGGYVPSYDPDDVAAGSFSVRAHAQTGHGADLVGHGKPEGSDWWRAAPGSR